MSGPLPITPLAPTAEAQELSASTASLGRSPTHSRGQGPARRIDVLRCRGLPPFGLAGHLWAWCSSRAWIENLR